MRRPSQLAGLNVVVAAGIAAGAPLRAHKPALVGEVIEIDLLGVMYTGPATLPHLERNGGYLLRIASNVAVFRGAG